MDRLPLSRGTANASGAPSRHLERERCAVTSSRTRVVRRHVISNASGASGEIRRALRSYVKPDVSVASSGVRGLSGTVLLRHDVARRLLAGLQQTTQSV